MSIKPCRVWGPVASSISKHCLQSCRYKSFSPLVPAALAVVAASFWHRSHNLTLPRTDFIWVALANSQITDAAAIVLRIKSGVQCIPLCLLARLRSAAIPFNVRPCRGSHGAGSFKTSRTSVECRNCLSGSFLATRANHCVLAVSSGTSITTPSWRRHHRPRSTKPSVK